MDCRVSKPSLRKPLGVGLILLIVAVWAIAVASASAWLVGLPNAVQAIVYLVLGIAWILPLGPVLRWMESGNA